MEAVKSLVRGKWQGDIKTTIMGNGKAVIEVIDKVGDHGRAFIFHDDESTDHGMVGKTFAADFGEFLNKRKV